MTKEQLIKLATEWSATNPGLSNTLKMNAFFAGFTAGCDQALKIIHNSNMSEDVRADMLVKIKNAGERA